MIKKSIFLTGFLNGHFLLEISIFIRKARLKKAEKKAKGLWNFKQKTLENGSYSPQFI